MLFDTTDGQRDLAHLACNEPAFWGTGNFTRTMRRMRFSPDGRYLVVSNWWPTP